MAQQNYEMMDSRSTSTNSGKSTGSRTFVVWDDSSPIEKPSEIILGSGGLPGYGDLFPGSTSLYLTAYTIEHIPDSSKTWKIVFQYETGDPTGISPPSEPGYLQVSIEYQVVPKDVYRTGGNKQNGTPNDQDIGGVPVDSGGVPTTIFVPLHTLILEETVSSVSLPSRSENIRFNAGTRNSASFYGASTGTLLYEGASARRIGVATYSLVHRFSYDPDYHMIQVPKRNGSGKVDLEVTASKGSYAGWVRFIQPFPATSNFNSLSENF